MHVLLGAAALVLLPPWVPSMPRSGLDPSWAMVLNHAFVNGWQFGSDLVFTFGPFGFLYARLFDPLTYSWVLGAWTLLALALGTGTAFLLRDAEPWEAIAIAALVLLGVRASMLNAMLFSDTAFFVLPLLLVLVVQRAGTPARVFGVLVCLLAALASLVKFTFWMLGFVIILMMDAERCRRGKRMPAYLLVYALGSLALHVVAGQSLAGYAKFVWSSLAVAGGYSEAMQVWSWRWLDPVAFVVLAVAFVVLAGYSSWRSARIATNPWTDWLPLAALVMFLFMVFKAGFVRHDTHAVIAWGGLTAGLALAAAHFSSRLRTRRARVILVLLCVVSSVVAIRRNFDYASEAPGEQAPLPLGGSVRASINAMAALTSGRHLASLRADHAQAIESIRRSDPLPALQGPVDVYPWNAAPLLAQGASYRPRPVFQSFAVYNPTLIRINREHLEGPRAAATLLFGIESIDSRHVAQDEGALWPTLAALYEVDRAYARQVVLHRRAEPRRIEWQIGRPQQVRWGQRLAVPQSEGNVWVQVRLQRTAWGRIQDVLFKAPVVNLVLELEDGRERRSRLEPSFSGEPFLLSPLVATASDWTAVFGDGGNVEAVPRVVRLRIDAPEPRTVAPVYADAIDVTFSHVAIEARR
ncbi:hypothetical protein [Piscinibacter koreensis]|uniref:Uncharacterized protein n=1 Tax=Piscinibacter koreensis TaxID=2742824 RepID=A0A7Y6NL12_9BURK|nr:hypothetical protein [Schlegelella koreensis]NUZ05170.1 hypothetical protein [Schlegelella koreensis]